MNNAINTIASNDFLAEVDAAADATTATPAPTGFFDSVKEVVTNMTPKQMAVCAGVIAGVGVVGYAGYKLIKRGTEKQYAGAKVRAAVMTQVITTVSTAVGDAAKRTAFIAKAQAKADEIFTTDKISTAQAEAWSLFMTEFMVEVMGA